MTREEILAGDEAALREAIRVRTGAGPVGRRTLQGLQELTARAYEVRLDAPVPDAVGADARATNSPTGTAFDERGGVPVIEFTGDPPEMVGVDEIESPPPAAGLIRVRVARDYWPADGSGRTLPGTVLDLPEAEAKTGIRNGVLEWL